MPPDKNTQAIQPVDEPVEGDDACCVRPHSRIETTMGYLHLSDALLEQNYERFLPQY